MSKMCDLFVDEDVIEYRGACYFARLAGRREDTREVVVTCPRCKRRIGGQVYEGATGPSYIVPPHKKKGWWRR